MKALLTVFFAFAAWFLTTAFLPIDRDATRFTYPYPVKFYSFQAQGGYLRMAYMDIEPENGNGQTVVLLHGKNFSGAYWKPTIDALVAGGYRVVVPDQIGFGKSTKPVHLQYSFQALASWTKDLLEERDVKNFIVVGHSMGGMLAARMALLYPSYVQKLVLVNPIGLEDWKTKVPYRTIDDWYETELKQTPETIREYQKQAYYSGVWKPEYDANMSLAAGWTMHPDYGAIAWNSALIYDMMYTQPVVYELKNIKTPTLLIIGTRDRTAIGKDLVKDKTVAANLGRYDILGKETAKIIPNSQLVELDTGHLPQVEKFDDYIGAMKRFLAGQPAALPKPAPVVEKTPQKK